MRVLTVDGQRDRAGRRGRRRARSWSGTSSPSCPPGAIFLGEADGVPYAARPRASASLTVSGRPVDTWAGLREVGADLGDLDAGLLVQAIGILEWHERNRFSPLTGAATTIERHGWVQRDPATGVEVFPRTDPAVIMLVHDGGDRVVLGRQAVWPPGRFSILAGFVEPGESAEAAVAREVAEEVGLRVTDIRYVGSQPWPFPQSLMLGFVARADGGDDARASTPTRSRRPAGSPARSCARATGPRALPPPVSIARHILDRWVAGEFSCRLRRSGRRSTRAGRSGWSASTTASARAPGRPRRRSGRTRAAPTPGPAGSAAAGRPAPTRRWTTTSNASPTPCSSAPGTSSTPPAGIGRGRARAARSRSRSHSAGR